MRSASMIWRMKFEWEASSCFRGEAADMALTGIRAILPQRSAIARRIAGSAGSRRGEREGEADRHGRGERSGRDEEIHPAQDRECQVSEEQGGDERLRPGRVAFREARAVCRSQRGRGSREGAWCVIAGCM